MALDRLLADPRWNVVGLLTTLDRSSDRVAMHDVRGSVLRAQAAALRQPLVEMPIDWPAPNEVYLAAFAEALDSARRTTPDLSHIAFGDLFLADLRHWRETALERLGWTAEFPLWNEPTRALATAFVDAGHRAIVSTVDLARLPETFCGRAFDAALLAELPAGVDPCGENGEFHTLCHSGPLFASPLPLIRGAMTTRLQRFRSVDIQLR
jgi:diphthamide synthase (EF-2-diphthine--ammonia ligase)